MLPSYKRHSKIPKTLEEKQLLATIHLKFVEKISSRER
jgi:hypothetical protein